MRTRPFRNALLVVASVAGTVGLIATAEAVMRWTAPARCATARSRAQGIAYMRDLARPPLETRRAHGGRSVWRLEPDGSAHRVGSLARTAGVTRTVVIGESSGDMLAQTMGEIVPGTDEVFDGARGGSGIAQLETNFDRALELAPDAVVIVFGHNLAFPIPKDSAALWFAEQVSSLCLLAALPSVTEMPRVERDTFEHDWARFEAFVHRATGIARARHVTIVGTTMASNRAMAPASNELDLADPNGFEAAWADATGHPDEAVTACRRAVTAHPDRAYAHFRLALALDALHRLDEARDEFVRARELDNPGRAPRAFNDRWRALAAREGIALRDTVHAVEDTTADPVDDWGAFRDNVHLRDVRLVDEAEAVLDLVHHARHLAPVAWPAARGPHPGLPSVFVRIANALSPTTGTIDPRWLSATTGMVAWAARHDRTMLAGMLPENDTYSRERGALTPGVLAQFHEAVAEGLWLAGDDAGATARNALARSLGSADAWVQWGLRCVRANQLADAHSAFEHALAIEHGRADATYYLARAAAAAAQGSGGPS